MAEPTQAQKVERASYYNDSSPIPIDEESSDTLEVVERLTASLLIKRNLAVTARASCGIEQIWREDEIAFEGFDGTDLLTRMIDVATKTVQPRTSETGPRRSNVYINVVRPKCETAEGRFADIQLPTDDRNWGLRITPVPELVKSLSDNRPAKLKGDNKPLTKNDGSSVTISEIATDEISVAKEKMAGMEREIDDQLTECEYNGESRKVIRDSVRLGTGVLKGPIVVKDLKKTWKTVSDGSGRSVQVLNVKEDFKPSSKHCSPWDVYPDPECGENVKKAAYMWEREVVLPRDLRDCIGVPGYLTGQIKKILAQEPTRVLVATPRENQYLIRYNTVALGNNYERWEYNGDLDKHDLEALGVDVSDIATQSTSACVSMVNDTPIKVMLNPLDTGDLPYDFFCWTTRAGLPWGMGVAREMTWQQRIIVAAWRAMMDNAGDSSGANIVVGQGVEPMDGLWELRGKKLWRALGEEVDVQKMFAQFQIENNQDELQSIIELALRFIDMETNLPMIFGGEKGELPETLGATNILVDSNNVAVRARVKLYDDAITRPHITRYYDWNMQYNTKEGIKGDFKVDARGTTVLLERDQQAQDIDEIMQLRGDPEIKDLVDWEKTIKKVFAARKLDILLPDEKIKENKKRREEAPTPSDPVLEVAKVRAQSEMDKLNAQNEATSIELNHKKEQAQLDRDTKLQLKEMDREIKMMELSATSGIALDKIKADLTEASAKLRTQVALAKDKDTVPAEQVAEPATEPVGRATEGKAFQE